MGGVKESQNLKSRVGNLPKTQLLCRFYALILDWRLGL